METTQQEEPSNTAQAQGAFPRWALHLSFVVAFTAMLSPALLNKYPLSADYLNHLSRVFILYHQNDPFLGKIFEIHFGIVPNIGLDALAYVLRPFGLEPNTVMKLIFVLSCIVLWSGIIAFSKSVHGRLQTSSLLLLPLSYSFVIAYGFFDFMLGSGLFLWCFSWIVRFKPSLKTSLIVINCASALIFFCHFGAWLIMIACLFLYRLGIGKTWSQSLGIAIGESILPSLLYILRVKNHLNSLAFASIPYKIFGFISLFRMSSLLIAFSAALIFCALLAALLHIRAIHLPPRWMPLIFGLGALSILAPFDFQASYFVDWRLIWLTSLFFLMTAEITLNRWWVETAIPVSVAVMLFPNIYALIHDTGRYNKDIDEFSRAIQVIPRDSFVFVSSYERTACSDNATGEQTVQHQVVSGRPPTPLDFMFYRSAPALLTPARHSVYPYVFAHRGAEAVFFRPAFSKYFSQMPRSIIDSLVAAYLATGETIPLRWKNDLLYDGSELSMLPFSLAPFMEKWNHRFSYVVHLQNGCPELGPYSALFKELARGSFFAIYKVTPTPRTRNVKTLTESLPEENGASGRAAH